MTKFEMEQIRKAVSEVLGTEVELVPMHNKVELHKEKSVDLMFLEMENRQRLAIERGKEMRAKRIQKRGINRFKSMVSNLVDNAVATTIELPETIKTISSKVKDIDVKEAIRTVWDALEDEDEAAENAYIRSLQEEILELEEQMKQFTYDHNKKDVVQKDNVAYLNPTFVDLNRVIRDKE